MNKRQFDIVKIMQKAGIPAKKFASACNEPTAVMDMAYAHDSFKEFFAWYLTFRATI